MDSFFSSSFARLVAASALIGLCSRGNAAPVLDTTLPTVNLGYARYSANVNQAGDLYTFSNLRYAAPPLASLRFAAPAPPNDENNLGIQDGSYGNICFQTSPQWLKSAASSLGPVASTAVRTQANESYSEDCLFLDVNVPSKFFNGDKTSQLAPVLVWIHGGFNMFGDKSTNFDPAGLLATANNNLITVSINYRLGTFGFLPASTGATPNAGLLDQRFALHWIQNNIHLFGGNSSQVTVMGEDSGASSIMFHIGAYGALQPKENNLFAGAIIQSPAIFNITPAVQQQTASSFFAAAGVQDINAARLVPRQTLVDANVQVNANATYGLVNTGPVIDGDLIREFPSKIFNIGNYIGGTSLKILSSTVLNVGNLFASPGIQTDADYTSNLAMHFPATNQTTLDLIANTLYPPVYDGSQGYKSPESRWIATVADSLVNCNVNVLNRAFLKAYAYQWSSPPAYQFSEVGADFYDTQNADGSQPQGLSTALQGYITQFALTGNPNGPNLFQIPVFGEGRKIVNFAPAGLQLIPDPNQNERCKWWQYGFAYRD